MHGVANMVQNLLHPSILSREEVWQFHKNLCQAHDAESGAILTAELFEVFRMRMEQHEEAWGQIVLDDSNGRPPPLPELFG